MATDKENTAIDKAINRSETEVAKLDVMNEYFLEKMGMSTEQMQLLRNWYPGITAPEIMYSVEFQREYGLSIMKREIWLIKRGGYREVNGKKVWFETYEPMVGIDGSRAAARNNAKNLGLEYRPAQTGVEIKLYPVRKNDKWVLEEDLIGWAEIDFGDHKTRLEVAYSECVQKTKATATEPARPTKFWDIMGVTMVQKVAEHRLNKKVYGLYLDSFESPEPSNLNEAEPGQGNTDKISTLKKMKALTNITKAETVQAEQETTEAEETGSEESTTAPFDADNADPETGEIDMTDFEKELARADISKNDIVNFFSDAKNKVVTFEDVNLAPEFEVFRQAVITNNNAQMTKLLNYKKSFTAKK